MKALFLVFLVLLAVPAWAGSPGGIVVEAAPGGGSSARILVDGVLAATVEARVERAGGKPVDLAVVYRGYCGGDCPMVVLVFEGVVDGVPERRLVTLSGSMYRTVLFSGLYPDAATLEILHLTVLAVGGGVQDGLDLAPLLGETRLDLALGRSIFTLEPLVEEPLLYRALFVSRDGEPLGTLTVSARAGGDGTIRSLWVGYEPSRIGGTLGVGLRVVHERGVYEFNLSRGAVITLPGPVPEGRVEALTLEAARGAYQLTLDLADVLGAPIVLGSPVYRVEGGAGYKAWREGGALWVEPLGPVDPWDLAGAWAECGGVRVPGAPVGGLVVFPLPDGCRRPVFHLEYGSLGARLVVEGVGPYTLGGGGVGGSSFRPAMLVISRENLDALSGLGEPPGVWGVVGGLGPGTGVVYLGVGGVGGVVRVEATVVLEEDLGGAVFSGVGVGGEGYLPVLVEWEGGGGEYRVSATLYGEEVYGVYIVAHGGRIAWVGDVEGTLYPLSGDPAGGGHSPPWILTLLLVLGVLAATARTRL